ncbi:hypothetical protein [Gracilimonas sp.]
MKKILLTSLIFLYLSQIGYSQLKVDSLEPENKILAKNAVFFEFLGSAGIYSFNYERVFENKLSLRAGLSYLPDDGFLVGHRVSIPVTSSYLISTDKDSHIELGLGSTFAFDSDLIFGLGPLAGFREQDLIEGGGYFRITLTPVFAVTDRDEFLSFLGGISFGASF